MNQRQRLLEQIRQQSIQKRAQALKEAAQRQANNAPITAAAGASSGGGGSRQAACDPEAGVTIYFAGGEASIVAVQGIYQGLDENGSPVYRADIISGLFEGTIDYDTETSQWRLTIIQGKEESYSYSPSLISQNWTDTIGLITPLYSVCGTLDLDKWCIDIPDFGFGPLKAQALPGWFGIPVTEQPNLWVYVVGIYSWFREGDQFGWFVELDEVGEVAVLGGSQDVLPSTVDIVTGITLTANAGACEY
jgi:hypothetical protein